MVTSSIEPVALARALASCADLGRRSSIAVIGTASSGYQLVLVEHGFLQVTAVSQRGAALLREHYAGVCLVEAPRDDTTLASLRRRVAPGGVLVIATARDTDRVALAARLHQAGFDRVQHRVIGLRAADGVGHTAVFLIARLAQAPDFAAPVPQAA